MIILGVDPGLTRCGVGVIEAGEHRRLSFIHVDVVRSSPDITQDRATVFIHDYRSGSFLFRLLREFRYCS